jgi:hypothetical protein
MVPTFCHLGDLGHSFVFGKFLTVPVVHSVREDLGELGEEGMAAEYLLGVPS